MTSSRDNIRGAGWMTLSMAGYVVNDSLIKLAVDDLDLFQAIFIRGICISLLLAFIARLRGELDGVRRHLHRPVLLRVTMEMAATICYLLALTNVPIAPLTAVLQLVPLAVTFAAAWILKESVGWRRYLSVGAGLVGVLFVVRPGTDDFSAWYTLGFAAVALIIVRELATKRVPSSVPSLVLALATGVTIMMMGGLVSIFRGWEPLTGRSVGLLVGASVFLALGYVGSVVTIRTGEVSFTAPFRYTVLVFAVILQIVVFDDVPDVLTFVGSAIVAFAGLFAFTREGAIPFTTRLRQV